MLRKRERPGLKNDDENRITHQVMLALCMVLAGVTACAEDNANAAAGHKVGFIQLTLVSNYHAAMSDHFEEIAEEEGLDAVMTNGEWKTDEQLQLCEDLIAQGCEAIILNPVGDEVVPIILARCQEAGIPLICVDNTSPGDGYTYIGLDNFAICRGIGQYIGDKYGEGKIVYLRSTANDTGCPAYRFGGIMAGLSDEGEVSDRRALCAGRC
jgi:ABC-type sugar transport system substrate-binding protein